LITTPCITSNSLSRVSKGNQIPNPKAIAPETTKLIKGSFSSISYNQNTIKGINREENFPIELAQPYPITLILVGKISLVYTYKIEKRPFMKNRFMKIQGTKRKALENRKYIERAVRVSKRAKIISILFRPHAFVSTNIKAIMQTGNSPRRDRKRLLKLFLEFCSQ
jgi:hypothetical protein